MLILLELQTKAGRHLPSPPLSMPSSLLHLLPPPSQQVMAVLLRKGRSTLADLILLLTNTLTRPQICRALLVLMQHNLLDSHLQIGTPFPSLLPI